MADATGHTRTQQAVDAIERRPQYTPNMLESLYIEYLNDYLTVEKMAEHKQLKPHHLKLMLDMGKQYHENPRIYQDL